MNVVCKPAGRFFMALLCACILAFAARAADSTLTLRSPDDRLEVQIRVTDRITYDVSLAGKLLLKDSSLAIKIGDKTLGDHPQLKSTKKNSVDNTLEPVVRQKAAKIREHYNE